MKIFYAIAPVFCAAALSAQSTIETPDGGRIDTPSITAAENGDLEFMNTATKTKMRIPAGRYKSARVPKPSEITAADSCFKAADYRKAAALYREAWTKYRFLGWDVYCVLMEADALAKSGAPGEAAARLERIEKLESAGDQTGHDFLKALRLAADLAADRGEHEKALALLDRLLKGKDGTFAASAFMKKGDVLLLQGKTAEASMYYFQTVLLFPDSPERPEALLKTCRTLTELKDSRAEKFAEMLRKEFPKHPAAEKLPRPLPAKTAR